MGGGVLRLRIDRTWPRWSESAGTGQHSRFKLEGKLARPTLWRLTLHTPFPSPLACWCRAAARPDAASVFECEPSASLRMALERGQRAFYERAWRAWPALQTAVPPRPARLVFAQPPVSTPASVSECYRSAWSRCPNRPPPMAASVSNQTA